MPEALIIVFAALVSKDAITATYVPTHRLEILMDIKMSTGTCATIL